VKFVVHYVVEEELGVGRETAQSSEWVTWSLLERGSDLAFLEE
jgi:hypothetical protein